MPKIKTHSSAKKRFKVTGTGKIMRFSANSSHLMRKKTKKAKRHLRGSSLVFEGEQDRVKVMLVMK
jgi:large subunit ribosomal protein L35